MTNPPTSARDIVISVSALRASHSPISDTAASLLAIGATSPGETYALTAGELSSACLTIQDLEDTQFHWIPELQSMGYYKGIVESTMSNREGDVVFTLVCCLSP